MALGLSHLVLLLSAGWLYLPSGSAWITAVLWQAQSTGDPMRRSVLWLFGLVFWLRLLITGLYLLRRRFGWEEFWPVVCACAIYQIGFAVLGTSSAQPLGAWDFVGIALFVIGSYLNTGSEYQRKRFKDQPANQGKLYRNGLFRYIRHVNYLGDSLWVLGWAILTTNLGSLLIPALLTTGFVFYFIPSLSRYLHERYGESYEQWTRTSWAFVPFIY